MKFGIMQGRLTEPRGRGIQFFPFENWREEFTQGKKLGLDEIEFIFDYDRYQENPLWQGRGEMVGTAVSESGVQVRSVCFDYFMRRAFYKKEGAEREALLAENRKILQHVLTNMLVQGITLIEIPLVDDSSLQSASEASAFKKFLLPIVAQTDVSISFGLETDLEPHRFVEYLESFGTERVGANYDSGNSSGLGYDPYEEIMTLGGRILNIHIKDRQYHGTTKQLGTGSADFCGFFRALCEIGYDGSLILQAARGVDGHEVENIAWQLRFVREWLANVK